MTKPTLRWGVFGGTWVSDGAGRLTLPPQSRRVLGVLLAAPGRAVPGERLVRPADDATPEQIANAARVAVSRLRTSLTDAGAAGAIVTTPTGYAVDCDHATVDHVRFSQLLRQAEATEWPADALGLVDQALALWTGPPFGELADLPDLSPVASALEEEHRAAVDRRCLLSVDVGAAVVAEIEAAVADDPYRERRWEALMLAHYRAGDQRTATDTYERARRRLRDDLGIEPGPDLQRLLSAILDHDPRLDWRPVRTQQKPAGAGTGRATTVIGREDELADLASLLERRRTVVVTGCGGVGKTSLAVEAATRRGGGSWVVPVTEATGSRVVAAVAGVMGVSEHEPDLATRIARHLDDAAGLLVLDAGEQCPDAVVELVGDLVERTTSARFLVTSRTELGIAGAVTFTLGPLPIGTADEPGPAALLAADAALIRPSQIRDRWSVVEDICGRADGVPLALELLGAAFADGTPLDLSEVSGLAEAVAVAAESLPTESRYVLNVLRVLPIEVGVGFLGELTGLGNAIHRVLGPVVRAGLAVHASGPKGTRVRLLDPVRDHLTSEPALEVVVVKDLARTFSELAAKASPSLIETIASELTLFVDEEHELGMWLVDQLDPDEALELACDLVPVWRSCSRHVDGKRVLERLEPAADASPPLVRALYWVRRSQMSPSLADRAPLVAQLQSAMAVAGDEGDDALRLRAGAELTVGLGWSGQVAEAHRLLEQLKSEAPPDNRWANLNLRRLGSMGLSLAGNPGRAAAQLLAQADEHKEIDHPGEYASCLHVAVATARLAGDRELLARALVEAESIPDDRFSAYPLAAIAFERARLALAEDDPAAGPLLWQAFGKLQAHGERRAAATCRRELGWWRLRQGDPAGTVDLAVAALELRTVDPSAAAVAIARLVELAPDGLTPEEADGLRSAVVALMRRGVGLPLEPSELAEIERVVGAGAERPAPEDRHDEAQQWEILGRLARATTP